MMRRFTFIASLIVALALGSCSQPGQQAAEVARPSIPMAPQTVVVPQTVIVPQTVVLRQTVIVPQTVLVPQTVVIPQTVVVRATVIVTTTSGMAHTAAAIPAAKAAYTLSPIAWQRDANGSLRFTMEITNTSSAPFMETRVVLTLRDAHGAVLDTESGLSPVDILLTGQKIPITIVVPQEPPGWSTFEVKATGNVASEVRLKAYSTELNVLHSKFVQDGTSFKVTGEVKNEGNEPVQFTRVVAGLYNESGALVGTRDGYAALSELAPGETSPFALTGIVVTQKPASVKVWTSARVQY
jgi:hypothetical protein